MRVGIDLKKAKKIVIKDVSFSSRPEPAKKECQK
jgi:hypothetical protein